MEWNRKVCGKIPLNSWPPIAEFMVGYKIKLMIISMKAFLVVSFIIFPLKARQIYVVQC